MTFFTRHSVRYIVNNCYSCCDRYKSLHRFKSKKLPDQQRGVSFGPNWRSATWRGGLWPSLWPRAPCLSENWWDFTNRPLSLLVDHVRNFIKSKCYFLNELKTEILIFFFTLQLQVHETRCDFGSQVSLSWGCARLTTKVLLMTSLYFVIKIFCLTGGNYQILV